MLVCRGLLLEGLFYFPDSIKKLWWEGRAGQEATGHWGSSGDVVGRQIRCQSRREREQRCQLTDFYQCCPFCLSLTEIKLEATIAHLATYAQKCIFLMYSGFWLPFICSYYATCLSPMGAGMAVGANSWHWKLLFFSGAQLISHRHFVVKSWVDSTVPITQQKWSL